MLEPEEMARWARHARALARKADDAAALAQVLQIVEQFEDAAMLTVGRLLEQGFSYGELARDLGTSRQAVRQRYLRWLDRHPEQSAAPALRAGERAQSDAEDYRWASDQVERLAAGATA